VAEEEAHPIIMGPGEGEKVDNPAGGRLTYKARGGQTGGGLTVCETTAAPGEGPPLHLHVSEDEFLYVLEGRLRVRLDGHDHTAAAGAFTFIPRGVPHTWQNEGNDHARMLIVFTPGSPGMERFFERSMPGEPGVKTISIRA